MQPPKQEKPTTTRPSLMSASDTPGSDEVRILNSISDGKTGARASATGGKAKSGRKTAIVAALLLLIGAAAVAVFYASAPSGEPVSAAMQDRPAAQLVAAADPSPPVTTPSAVAAPALAADAPKTDAAVITDTAPAPAAEAPARSQDQLTSALEEGVKPPPAALKNALEAKPEKPAKHAAAHDDKKKKTAKADPKTDSDVDLIKALVARSAEVDKKRAAREPTASQKLAQSDAGQASKPAAGRNVDVVERNGSESTESLLQRCRALGLVEGEFCRWRICSGRWDSDPACKIPNSN